MKQIKIDGSLLNPLYKALRMLEQKSQGIIVPQKDVPMWLPNGEEIKTLEEMATMLNTDIKTAAYCVLDSKNAPMSIRLEASYEVKEIIRHVRTPGGAEKYGEPIGTVIKLDELGNKIDIVKPNSPVMKDVIDGGKQPPLPGMPKKKKYNVFKHKPIEIDAKAGTSTLPIDMRSLGNTKFEPLKPSPFSFNKLPHINQLKPMTNNFEFVQKEQSDKLSELYHGTINADIPDDYAQGMEHDSQLKANVMHNISQRIIDHSLNDKELQNWTHSFTQNLFVTNNPLTRLFSFDRYDDESTNKKVPKDTINKSGHAKKLMILKDFGIVPEETTLEELTKPDSLYADFMAHKGTLLNMFTKTGDREKIIRYGLLKHLGLSSSYEFVPFDKNGKPNTAITDNISKSAPNKFDAHTTAELVILYKTDTTIREWAGTSADTSISSVSLQREIKDYFGMDDETIDHINTNTPSDEDSKVFRKNFIKAVYEETQDFFKANEITHVELYRGMAFEDPTNIPIWADDGTVQDLLSNLDETMDKQHDEFVSNYIEENFSDDDFMDIVSNEFDKWFQSPQNYVPLLRAEIIKRQESGDEDANNPDWVGKTVNGDPSIKNGFYESQLLNEIRDDVYNTWHEENDYGEHGVIEPSLISKLKKGYELQLEQNAQEMWEDSGQEDSYNSLQERKSDYLQNLDQLEGVDTVMQPASSWSIDLDEAYKFANGDVNLILHSVVPVERIFSTAFSGIGCLTEGEMVVLGGKGLSNVGFK